MLGLTLGLTSRSLGQQMPAPAAPTPGMGQQMPAPTAPMPGMGQQMPAPTAPTPGQRQQAPVPTAPMPGMEQQAPPPVAPMPGMGQQTPVPAAPIPPGGIGVSPRPGPLAPSPGLPGSTSPAQTGPRRPTQPPPASPSGMPAPTSPGLQTPERPASVPYPAPYPAPAPGSGLPSTAPRVPPGQADPRVAPVPGMPVPGMPVPGMPAPASPVPGASEGPAATFPAGPTAGQGPLVPGAGEPETAGGEKAQVSFAPEELSSVERLLSGGVPDGAGILRQFGYDVFTRAPTTFAPVTDVPVGPDYVIGPGDNLNILLWGGVQEGYQIEVNRNGTIALPRLGAVQVWGLTIDQVQQLLQQRFGEFYPDFHMAVTLGKLRTILVYVVGEVRQPGAYHISSLSTMVNALFVSGGPTKSGTLRRIQLVRAGQGIHTLDLYDFLL